MKTRKLGGTEFEVGVIGLGGMPLSLDGRPSEADAIRVIHAALDGGMTLIDTADVYCIDDNDIGHNERLIAKALLGRRERVVVATKGGLRRPRGDWTTDGSPKQLRRACEASLVALGVTCIDLYQLHAPDDRVPLEESVGMLARLREEGKIRHVGLSNVDTDELERASKIVPIVSVQNRLNPHDLRSVRNGVLAACAARGIAFLPYSPVGGGRGKEKIARDPRLVAVGQKIDASPFEVALAWVLSLAEVMLPIPGASRVESAMSSARAASLELSRGDLRHLDDAYGFSRS